MMKFFITAVAVICTVFTVVADEKQIYSQQFNQKSSAAGVYKEKGFVGELVFSGKNGRAESGAIGIKTSDESGLAKGMSMYIPAIPMNLKMSYVCRIFVKKQKKLTNGSIKLTIRPRNAEKEWLWKAQPFTKIIKIATLKDSEWNEIQFEFIPRSDDAEWKKGKSFAILYTVANANGQTVWFDDFEVIEK
jgi:hypothetical protein